MKAHLLPIRLNNLLADIMWHDWMTNASVIHRPAAVRVSMLKRNTISRRRLWTVESSSTGYILSGLGFCPFARYYHFGSLRLGSTSFRILQSIASATLLPSFYIYRELCVFYIYWGYFVIQIYDHCGYLEWNWCNQICLTARLASNLLRSNIIWFIAKFHL